MDVSDAREGLTNSCSLRFLIFNREGLAFVCRLLAPCRDCLMNVQIPVVGLTSEWIRHRKRERLIGITAAFRRLGTRRHQPKKQSEFRRVLGVVKCRDESGRIRARTKVSVWATQILRSGHKPTAPNITQESQCAEKVGLARGVRADDEETRGQVELDVGEVAPVRDGDVRQLHVVSFRCQTGCLSSVPRGGGTVRTTTRCSS